MNNRIERNSVGHLMVSRGFFLGDIEFEWVKSMVKSFLKYC